MRVHVEEKASTRPHMPDSSAGWGFGKYFTHRMLLRYWQKRTAWDNTAVITGVHNFPWLHPGASVLHYAGEIFEGQKAYRGGDGKIRLFRPEMNAARFNRSAERMAMPQMDEQEYLQMIERLVKEEYRWVPAKPNTSLYIRPAMIAASAELGLHISDTYLFYVLLSLAGDYFPGGFHALSMLVEEHDRRSVLGGVGGAKTGANYAASQRALRAVKQQGYDDLLWLNAMNGKTIEEACAMNIAFVADRDTIVTPPLNGSILPGITRDSVRILAKDLGLKAVEQSTDIDDLVRDIQHGKITELFGMGTAAVIAPIGMLGYAGENIQVGDGKVGPVATVLRQTLLDIQYGRQDDPYGWIQTIDVKRKKKKNSIAKRD